MRPEVLVVGAGATGLTVACQLRRLGVSVRIVDKKAGFSATSKAIGLQHRVSDILACMGVADRSLAKGNTLIAVNIFVRDRRLVQLKFVASGTETGWDAFQPRAIVIPQNETERLLRLSSNGAWRTYRMELRISRVRKGCARRSITAEERRCGTGMHIRLADQL